jgi:hypothetical protein
MNQDCGISGKGCWIAGNINNPSWLGRLFGDELTDLLGTLARRIDQYFLKPSEGEPVIVAQGK